MHSFVELSPSLVVGGTLGALAGACLYHVVMALKEWLRRDQA